MSYEFKRVDVTTAKGLKEAKRLHQDGWIIILNSLRSLLFQREKVLTK